jgi:predicted NAD/FAD-dependent oxidoreductase
MATAPAPRDTHWVAQPGMNSLLKYWTEPLQDGQLDGTLQLESLVERIEPDALRPQHWQLRLACPGGAQQVLGGFDDVVLALPHQQSLQLLQESALAPALQQAMEPVLVAPCWTLMLAFPQASPPDLPFGPSWHAARSKHHRVRWVARENSKPGRGAIERWTVQASPDWSTEHLEDDPERVKAKLLKGFAEITGIRATPSHAVVHRWRYAQTQVPLGRSHLHDSRLGLGLCGDWCLGHRIEDAFVSGLELALAMV